MHQENANKLLLVQYQGNQMLSVCTSGNPVAPVYYPAWLCGKRFTRDFRFLQDTAAKGTQPWSLQCA